MSFDEVELKALFSWCSSSAHLFSHSWYSEHREERFDRDLSASFFILSGCGSLCLFSSVTGERLSKKHRRMSLGINLLPFSLLEQ